VTPSTSSDCSPPRTTDQSRRWNTRRTSRAGCRRSGTSEVADYAVGPMQVVVRTARALVSRRNAARLPCKDSRCRSSIVTDPMAAAPGSKGASPVRSTASRRSEVRRTPLAQTGPAAHDDSQDGSLSKVSPGQNRPTEIGSWSAANADFNSLYAPSSTSLRLANGRTEARAWAACDARRID